MPFKCHLLSIVKKQNKFQKKTLHSIEEHRIVGIRRPTHHHLHVSSFILFTRREEEEEVAKPHHSSLFGGNFLFRKVALGLGIAVVAAGSCGTASGGGFSWIHRRATEGVPALF